MYEKIKKTTFSKLCTNNIDEPDEFDSVRKVSAAILEGESVILEGKNFIVMDKKTYSKIKK